MYYAPVRAPAAGIDLKKHVTPFRLAVVLALLGLGLRLFGLGSRPLWLDEAFSAWFSERSFPYLWTVLPTFEPHPPFYYSLLKLRRSIAGDGHAEMRALSVGFSVATVPVIMAAALEHERQSPTGRPLLRAGIAGFLAAASPMLVFLGQEARPYPLLAFSYAVAILALLRLMREFKATGAGSWSSWLLLGAAAEVTLWAHGLGLLYGGCLALALLPPWVTSQPSGMRLLRGAATAVIVGLAYVPCLLMMAGRTQDWGSNWLRWDPTMLLELLTLYSVPVDVLNFASAIAAIAMLLLIARALAYTWASEGWNADRALLLLWLGPPVLAALISALLVPVFLDRTLSGTLIPAYLAIASAIARIRVGQQRRVLAAAICITLLPATLTIARRLGNERWDLLSSFLSRNVGPKDEVWLYPSDSALPLAAVGYPSHGAIRAIPAPFPTLGVKGPIRAGWPAVVSVTPEQAGRFASDPALADVPVIWLVTRQNRIFDPDDDMPRALARVRRPGRMQEWAYIGVRPYYRR
jgi:uncharacterized membrane protein